MAPLSMRQLAKLAGVSQSTVSLALRGHKSISHETRTRIQELALSLDYRQNDMVSMVLGSVRRKTARKWNLAWLNATPSRQSWETSPILTPFLIGAESRAKALGCSIDQFWVGDPGFSSNRLSSILHARGIDGLMLAGVPRVELPKFTNLPVISLGRCEGVCRSVAPNILRNVEMLVEQMFARKFQRVGFVYGVNSEHFFADSIHAGCRLLAMEHSAEAFQSLAVNPTTATGRSQFLKWLASYQPDGVACALDEVPGWCAAEGIAVPRDLKLAHLFAGRRGQVPAWSGIDQRLEAVGALLIDELTAMLKAPSLDEEAESVELLVGGRWIDGDTL